MRMHKNKVMKPVGEALIEGLKEMGADGLCVEDCGCGFDNFVVCGGEGVLDCVPAKAVKCPPKVKDDRQEPQCQKYADEACYCYDPDVMSTMYRPLGEKSARIDGLVEMDEEG